jgi:excisionase family DNA binding protein
MTLIPNKESFRPDEAAILLGVSRRTVFRWLKKGVVEACSDRGYQRIPRQALLAMISGKGGDIHVGSQMDG